MPELTPRLGIEKPTGNEHANRQSINRNWDIIDEKAETIQGAQAKADAAEQSAKDHADQRVGNLSNLPTQDKSNLVNSIIELFQSVSDGKITIADAIADMNQSATGNMTFAQLAAAIRKISDDANATASQVLLNRVFYQGGQRRTGTMPNRSGNVNAQSRSRSGTTLRLRPPEGYFNGNTSNSVQTSDSNWIASNIRNGISLFGLTGNLVEREFATGTTTCTMLPMTGVTGQRPIIKVTGLAFQPRVIIAQRRSVPGVVTVFVDSALNGRETATTVARVDTPLIEPNRSTTGSGGVFVYTNSSGFEISVGNVNEGATFDWIAFR